MGHAPVAAVVRQHLLLQLYDARDAQPALGLKLPVVGKVINAKGNQHKKDHARAQRSPQLFVKTRIPHRRDRVFAHSFAQRPEKQHRQPRAPIHADPLDGAGQPHHQPGQEKGNQRFGKAVPPPVHLRIARHKQRHQHDEQHREAVHRGDARLDEVHEIYRKKQHGKQRELPFMRQLHHKQVHRGQHQHAKKRAHKAPSEGRHTKELHPQHDEHLAKRRMRPLVGGQALLKFIGRARVIHLVKIRAVHIGARLGNDALLV